MTKHKYKAVIFDLDDTLFDTWGMCYPAATLESCDAMIKAGLNCTREECINERQAFFRSMPKRDVFQHMLAHFGSRNRKKSHEEIIAVGKKAFHSRQVEKDIKLFSQGKSVLGDLSTKYLLFLVTSGDPDTQKQKVDILRIKDFFTHIFYVNTLKKERKTKAFLEILERTGIEPKSILCFGDRRDREIAEGKRLGFDTCLIKRDHQLSLIPDLPEEFPDFEIDHLSELIERCGL